MMNRNEKSKVIKSLIVTAMIVIQSPAFSQSCVEVKQGIINIQSNQYNLKGQTRDEEGNTIEMTLFELEKEYDKTLAQASILQGLNQLNEEFFRAARETTVIDEEGFDNIISGIDAISKSENLGILQNMATMDALLQDLKDNSIISSNDDGSTGDEKSISIDFSSSVSPADQATERVRQLKSRCPDNSGNPLCEALKANNEGSVELVKSFILAFSANQDNAHKVIREENLTAYRAVLRRGISDETDLGKLFQSARAVTDTSEATRIINQIKQVGSAEGPEVQKLQRAYCCTLTQAQFNNRATCKNDSEFARNQCSTYTDNAATSFSTIFRAFNNYENQINSTLSTDFNFNNMNDHPLDRETPAMRDRIRRSSPVIARYMDVLSGSIFGGGRSAVTSNLEGLSQASQGIDNTASSMISRINNIFRRGRLTLEEGEIPTAVSFSPSVASTGDMPSVVALMNAKTCNLATALNEARGDATNSCPAYFALDPADQSKILTVDPVKLSAIFHPGTTRADKNAVQAAWANQLSEIENSLAQKRAEINRLKSGNAYSHLDQLKRFMIWDLQARCADSYTTEQVSPQCGQNGSDSVSYLVLTEEVGSITSKLLAEISPATIANSDLTNANLQQRRVILGNMNGACQGLNRLNEEQPNQGFSSQAITNACTRVASMNTAASTTTSFERDETIRSRGYRLTSDGDYARRPSSGQQIGLGALRGLGTSAPMLAGTFFSGQQLSGSLPFQEQLIYNQMDQQYAFNWWQQNAPFNYMVPGAGGFANPYYLPQIGNTSSGFNFNTGGF